MKSKLLEFDPDWCKTNLLLKQNFKRTEQVTGELFASPEAVSWRGSMVGLGANEFKACTGR